MEWKPEGGGDMTRERVLDENHSGAGSTRERETRRRKSRRTGSEAPQVGTRKATRGSNSVVLYLKTRSSSRMASPIMRTQYSERTNTLAGNSMIRKHTQIAAQNRTELPAASG